MARRACLCGVVDCARHGRRSTPKVPGSYGAAYQSTRAVLMARWVASPMTACWICGSPARAGDPWEPDHVIPVAEGGTDHPSNLRPAHRLCNRRRGARMRKRQRVTA